MDEKPAPAESRALPAPSVRDLAGRVVASCAPEEAAYFDLTADAYFAGRMPRRAARWPVRRRASGTPTGFGVPEAVDLITPAVLAVLTGAASDLFAGWLRTTTGRRRWWRRRRRPVPERTRLVAPADADWDALERQIAAAALREAVTPRQAAAIAASVRAELEPPARTAPPPAAPAPAPAPTE
ncbi:hypothetical protein A6A06_12890 [Streptomyces sp. CB02923]|uniref:hypothetical protein n=1 Tax=Streptomyces sp. CB02923 TaxID=1718985 RepID=UPI00093A6D33|nr:hypothetical protein [Streptomyces sp. CB02923]OKI02003.1 hypothetical protein A6A06_12890 [Streptomyces sp. CB02923]